MIEPSTDYTDFYFAIRVLSLSVNLRNLWIAFSPLIRNGLLIFR
jgi:hypothetical protein